MYNNTTGTQNTAIGAYSLQQANGSYNVAIGYNTLYSTSATYNTAVGNSSLYSNSTGAKNTAIGHSSLNLDTTGAYNVAIGDSAMKDNVSGLSNITIGCQNDIGTYAPVSNIVNVNNRISMGSTAITGAYIQVPWTTVSDARDKTEFGVVHHGLDFVKQLNPVSYKFKVDRFKEETSGPVRYGFKAQDILELERDHPVIIDNEDPDKLRMNGSYIIPILVNAIKELNSKLDELEYI